MPRKTKSGRPSRGTRHPKVSLVLALVVIAVAASGCDWSLFGYSAANTRSSADTGISTSTVGSLARSWSHTFSGVVGAAPAESGGIVYATSSDVPGVGLGHGMLSAFSAASCPSSPTSCAPLWTAPVEYGTAMVATPVVAGGEVYVSNGADKAAFPTDRSSCPMVTDGGSSYCTPLRIYLGTGTGYGDTPYLVTNDTLYAGGTGEVFSADGSQGCGYRTGVTWLGAPIVACSPVRTDAAPAGWKFTHSGTPTVVTATAGPFQGRPILYLEATTTSPSSVAAVFAYDASGANGCSGTPVVCSPLWADIVAGSFPIAYGSGTVAVANGYAYVGGANATGQATLFAFEQNGVDGKGAACGFCSPAFQSSSATGSALNNVAATKSTVVATTAGGELVAFGATGTGTPVWGPVAACADYSGPNVANGVVYVGRAGLAGCTAPRLGVAAYSLATGALLWSEASPDGGNVADPPIVADGAIYYGTGNGGLYADAP